VAVQHTLLSLERGIHPIIGTTGISKGDLAVIEQQVERTGVAAAIIANFSLGAMLLSRFALMAAQYYTAVEIVERHHAEKRDAPSGTALRLAQRLAHEGYGRPEREIPIHSLRLPGYVAHHEVIFGGQGERLTLVHATVNRESFASGVLLTLSKIDQFNRVIYDLSDLMD